MSTSIPFFFRPLKLEGNTIVDGAMLSNFPIWIFDSITTPRWPTFGILLSEPQNEKPNKVDGIVSYAKAIFKTMMNAHDRRSISNTDYKYRVIKVPTGNIGTIQFDITTQEKEWLYHSGYTSAKDFLADWEWLDYVNWAKETRRIR